MAVLSKFAADVLGLRVLTSNCYETTHPWNPDCHAAIKDAVPEAFRFCLKTYGLFYIFSSLVSAKGDPRKIRWKSYIRSTLQSSVFLTVNLVMYLWYMCRIRRLLGFYTWPTLGLANGLLSSFTAILFEKSSRRPALALYLTNLASETAYRQLVNHGYLKYIPNGQWIVFAVGLAILFVLRQIGKLDASTNSILEKIHGVDSHSELPQFVWKQMSYKFQRLVLKLRAQHKQENCQHPHSCLSAAIEPAARSFSLGLAASSTLALIRNIRSPSKAVKVVFNSGNFRLPVFLALMPLIYNGVNCGLQYFFPGKKVTPIREGLAGFASGLAMTVFPNVTIAMYILWKAIDCIYNELKRRGLVRPLRHGDILLYTIATGYVLFVAGIEPHALRYGYYKFLMGLSGNRLALFNRILFDEVGFNSSAMYPGFVPKFEAKFASTNPMLYAARSRTPM